MSLGKFKLASTNRLDRLSNQSDAHYPVFLIRADGADQRHLRHWPDNWRYGHDADAGPRQVLHIKSLDAEPIGALALYSYSSEDYFGTMKKRIIEEYMDNFASALIIALIEKASQENQRMKELLESYGERLSTEFRGVGPVVEHLLRRAGEKTSWNEIMADLERFFIGFALRRAHGRVYKALELLKMPKRTFYNKVKKLGIDVPGLSRRTLDS